MGLFGPRIPKEQKEFKNAFKKAMNKPNEKAITALEAATAAYPAGWQGHWLIALYHDQGFGRAAVNEAKAQEHFLQAETAAKGTDGEAWLRTFMTWYRRDAGNLHKPLTDKQKKFRRMGVAMCRTYQHNNNVLTGIIGEYEDDGFNMSTVLSYAGELDDEQYPFRDFLTVPTFDHDEQYKDSCKYLEKAKKSSTIFVNCLRAKRNDKNPRWDDFCDMYDYLYAYNCIEGGKLLTNEAAIINNTSEAVLGIKHYMFAADMGNQAAIHELIRLANASESNFNLMEQVHYNIHSYSKDDLNCYLLERMLECVKINDEEAGRLFELYYAEAANSNG